MIINIIIIELFAKNWFAELARSRHLPAATGTPACNWTYNNNNNNNQYNIYIYICSINLYIYMYRKTRIEQFELDEGFSAARARARGGPRSGLRVDGRVCGHGVVHLNQEHIYIYIYIYI